uniref:Flavodoxins n=1 Tax=uncultured bacterium Contig13 TaxID=1393410 RepID=W0FMG8_9BACT|nr:flavodoxins [uncultured bacterium Contig13]
MNKKILIILAALVLAMNCISVFAEDAVSSATVDITSVPAVPEHENAKALVIYFSTDDTVKAVALTAADALEADVFEVVPEQPYTDADLAYYTDCRADKEQDDSSARPGIAIWPESLEQYDVIFVGYPIWHGQAPRILYTLFEGIDVSGKTIVPFCTSASSGAGSSAGNLEKVANGAAWLKATRINNHSTAEQIQSWALSALAETKE